MPDWIGSPVAINWGKYGLVGADAAAAQALVSADGIGPPSRRAVIFGASDAENNQDLASVAFSSLTQTGGLATVAGVEANGQMIKISRVAQEGYYGVHQSSDPSAAADPIKFSVPADTASPATALVRPDGVSNFSTFLLQYCHRRTARGWMHLANYKAGGDLFEIVQNSAYGGDTTGGMLARIDHPEWGVTPFNADWCIIQSGMGNDLSAGVPYTTTISNMTQIFDHLRARGYAVIVATICPGNSSYSGTNDPVYEEGMLAINQWLRDYCATHPRMLCWDFFSVIADPTSNPVVAKTGYINSSDNTHLTPKAAWDLADYIINVSASMLPKAVNTLPSSIRDSREYYDDVKQNQLNPLFQGTTGIVSNLASGVVAYNWAANHQGNPASTAVASVVARTVVDDGDEIGNNQKVIITAAASGDSGYVRNTPSNHATLEVGKWYYVEAAVRIESWTNMDLPNLNYTLTCNGVSITATACHSGSSGTLGTQPSGISDTLVMKTGKFRVPVGTLASGSAQVAWRSNGVGGGTIYVGRMHVRQVIAEADVTAP